MALLRHVVELQLGGVWTDITTYVRHASGIRVQRGTTDESPRLNPAKATLVLHNNDDRFNPDNPMSPYSGRLVRNTPIRITCSGGVSDGKRFVGEVFAFVPQWNEDRSDCTVPITASGALRRMIARKVTPRTYYRSWMEHLGSHPWPRYFWPLEEQGDAVTATPSIGQGGAYFVNLQQDKPAWGKAEMNDWIPNGVEIHNLEELHFPCDMRGTSGSGWEVTMLLTFSDDNVLCTGTVDCGDLQYLWAMGTDTVTTPGFPTGTCAVYTQRADAPIVVTPIAAGLRPLKDYGPLWFTIRSWHSGVNQIAYFSLHPVRTESNSIIITTASSFARPSAAKPREVAVACSVDLTDRSARGAVGLSSVSVSESDISTTQMSNSYIATKGNPSEATYDRFARLAGNAGFVPAWSSDGGSTMGKQYPQSLEDHFIEILASSKHSGIVEARDTGFLLLLGQGNDRGSFAYSDLMSPLSPAVDDGVTVNILNVENSHGEAVTLTKAAGPMSVAAIGPFEDKWEPNNRKMQTAVSLAGLRLALGTWSGPRFPEVTLSARARPALYAQMRSIDVGDYFTITGMSSAGYYDDLVLKVLQVEERLSHEDHLFTFTVRPGEIDARKWTLGTNRVDIADSTVAVASGSGTVDVNVPNAKWSGSGYDIMIEGERMTVTNVATLTSTTQRLTVTRSVNGVAKVVGVGAEVHLYPQFFIKAV